MSHTCLIGNDSLMGSVELCLTCGCDRGGSIGRLFIMLLVLTAGALYNIEPGRSSKSVMFCSRATMKFFLKRGAKSCLDSAKKKNKKQGKQKNNYVWLLNNGK